MDIPLDVLIYRDEEDLTISETFIAISVGHAGPTALMASLIRDF
jgi:hypothetical protein